METFSALLSLCAGNSSVSGEFPSQRHVTRSFDVWSAPEKRLSKQSKRRWFVTPSSSLWRHCIGFVALRNAFTHILQYYFSGTGEIIWSPQCRWNNTILRYGLKRLILNHNKVRTLCILHVIQLNRVSVLFTSAQLTSLTAYFNYTSAHVPVKYHLRICVNSSNQSLERWWYV